MSPLGPGRADARGTGFTGARGTRGVELGNRAEDGPLSPGPSHPLEWPVYDDGVAARVAELVTLGRTFDYDYGPELAELERSFAERHGRAHALALTSGTAGLLAAYFALGVGPGDEVIVPDLTFFSTASPLFLLGAVPVLCDAGDASGNVAAADVEALVTPRTVAIVVTHLWGHSCDMDALRAVADRRGLALVEDCSHAHGSTFRSRPVGSMGDISIFSVGGRKLISGGMGGMLLTDSEDVFARACLLTNFRHRTDLTIDAVRYKPFLLTGLGGNFRISTPGAVLAQSHLDRLDELVERRVTNMSALAAGLGELPGVRPSPVAEGVTMGAWYDGVVEVTPECPFSRDGLVAAGQERGLKVRAPATRPLHVFPLFQGTAPDWSPQVATAVRAAAAVNDRPFPRSTELFSRWMKLPVNFLWEANSPLVGAYLKAFDDAFSMARTA
ncbi:DegT/DnrJ/EryC1/StrS family aminotransferase [Streptosporangium sp. G11]|uniref:DegT/DnrJ/EryC1/StrS family aminotransferase n=1 Tax=Streptosporangium sp. G11 TaxID=3436926 RepID=UPI003EB9C9AF